MFKYIKDRIENGLEDIRRLTTSRKVISLLLIVLSTVLVDQFSKWYVSKNLALEETIPVIKDFLHVTYVQNKGVVFGLFYGQIPVFNVVTLSGIVISLALIVYIFINKLTTVQEVAYSLILGGAIGNSLDRIIYGYVIDFIDFRGIWYYIFNGADSFINIGIILLFIENLFKKKEY